MTVASQVKGTLAQLKGIEASLEKYTAESEKADHRKLFQDNKEVVSQVIVQMEQRISLLELEEPQYKGL
ncbi:DUF1657 domain-containing protein [Thalassorhabdus alkalitolerans]|uniref:DUF1657 domain-containing protein n=1 Tax=Thalassorhabdus alkalitolerans TaxID=2282697 RepID=A0ABW0YRZ8_9BACI|nr:MULTISPECIES: DUF1657 domain-containing protein [Bacillaceae]